MPARAAATATEPAPRPPHGDPDVRAVQLPESSIAQQLEEGPVEQEPEQLPEADLPAGAVGRAHARLRRAAAWRAWSMRSPGCEVGGSRSLESVHR